MSEPITRAEMQVRVAEMRALAAEKDAEFEARMGYMEREARAAATRAFASPPRSGWQDFFELLDATAFLVMMIIMWGMMGWLAWAFCALVF